MRLSHRTRVRRPIARRLPFRTAALTGPLAAVLAAALTLPTAPTAAGASPPTPSPATPPAAPRQAVTLVTGDTVTLGAKVDGAPSVSIKPAEGSGAGGSFTTLRRGGDVYVVPDDVARLVPQVLDLELFNVSGLAAMGYDDTSTRSLPLIVRGPHPMTALTKLDAATGARQLPSIDAAAVSVPKDDAGRFTDALSTPTGLKAAGITKVWLDRRLKAADLDANLTDIGAPDAWDAGLSGAGVDVAVLDSGVDTTHPDLKDKQVTAANFTDSDSAADDYGHGTHVASVLTGTGAAANGARKGVAYGARLLSGKVLGADGYGQESWVIAGMQWAAEQGADVVNMSLGGTASSGDDPVAQALDRLTADTGTLFVVAAGNSGPGSSSIETPGVAASALTVGAANDQGRPPRFSSDGPTRGTYRAKPDLTAPGVNITGARMGGGTANPYTTMTGTSQATPHVAGAAALLREQHPGWDWRRIKAQLMSTADAHVPGGMPFAEGAGELDLTQATTDTLQLSRGNVDFGYLRYPAGTDPKSIDLTLTNTGAEPQTVRLSDAEQDVYHDAAPDDMVTLSRSELTVAPGGSEKVTVTLTPANGQPGVYSGLLTLARDGQETTTLPIGYYAEAPRNDVHLKVIDRNGQPWANGEVWLGNVQNMHPHAGGGFTIVHLDAKGEGTARVQPGPFSMVATVDTPATGSSPATLALAGSPEVMVDKDMSYTIDARKAERLRPATVAGAATKVTQASVHYLHQDEEDTGDIGANIIATPEEIEQGQLFLQPTEPVAYGKGGVETRWRLDTTGRTPRGGHGPRADMYALVLGGGPVPSPPVYRVTRSDARKLARLDTAYRALPGIRGTYSEHLEAVSDLVGSSFVPDQELSAPSHRVEMVTARPDVRWRHCVASPGEVADLCTPTAAYRAGARQSPVWYRGLAPAVIAGQQTATHMVLPVHLSDGEHLGRVQDLPAAGSETLRLWRDGVELSPLAPGSDYFASPPGKAGFRLQYTSAPDQAKLPIGTRTESTWTFPSQAPDDPQKFANATRLLTVDYRPDTDARGRLAPGRPLIMGARMISTDGVTNPFRAEPGTLRLWASLDHGRHWRSALVLPRGNGEFVTLVPGLIPRSGDRVSVRVSGKAAKGGRTIEQTIVDAYPVR